jgi:LCP family protein required for cell wall assembly
MVQEIAEPPLEDLEQVAAGPPATPEPRPPPSEPLPLVVNIQTPVPVTPIRLEQAPGVAPTPRATWVGPDTFTFVALGVDQRESREIPRTDTIVIGKVDLRTPRVNLISIPRDLLVEIPGYGKDRINSAYVYGEQFKEPGGGIGLLQRTIEKSFGVTVDHFGLIDFQCFRTAVDSIGGVTVNVPRAIVDPRYPTEDYGTKLVKFETGIQRMDGERALEYARTRSADSDFHRIQRQQLIIAAMRDQILQLRTLPALPTLLGGCRNMRSDLGWRDYLNLAASLQSLNSSRVTFAAIDERMVVDSVLSTGAAVLLPRWEPIRTLVAESFGPAPTTITTMSGAGLGAGPGAGADAVLAPSPFASPQRPNGSIASPLRPDPGDTLPGDNLDLEAPAATPSTRRT